MHRKGPLFDDAEGKKFDDWKMKKFDDCEGKGISTSKRGQMVGDGEERKDR
jgi:hypothetical protein